MGKTPYNSLFAGYFAQCSNEIRNGQKISIKFSLIQIFSEVLKIKFMINNFMFFDFLFIWH